MANGFIIPKKIIYGKDALNESGEYIKTLGKKALIITDSVMCSIGNVAKLTQVLDINKIDYELFSEVNSEPTDIMVEEGTKLYKEAKCDFLIALGGGSPIDTMKAVGVMVESCGSINDYLGKIIDKNIPNTVAIPTTSGTGSESTQFTIISNTRENIKMLLKGECLMPTLAVIDADMTLTSPKNVTAGTGIDALTHAIEAYTSKLANPLTDTFALSAIKRIFNNLKRVYENGDDFQGRSQMSLAALEAGIAFNNSSVTIIHGMSRPIGALFHVPHGVSNAMLLVECLNFAIHGDLERFHHLSKSIGVYKQGMTNLESAKAFVEAVNNLCMDINIPTLEGFGVNKESFLESLDKMAEDALLSGSPNNTRRKPTKEDLIQIYKKLWN